MTKTMEKYADLKEKTKKVMVPGLRQALNMKIGQVVRQGDIYIHCVDSSHPKGELLENHQLAVGETAGSRHIAGKDIEVYQGIELPSWVARNHFLGPVIICKNPSSLITHPEHANIALGKGTYQITHQMDIRTIQRVRD